MLRRFYFNPFEVSVGIFVMVNGFLTLFPGSSVRDALWNLLGIPGLAIPVFQILSGGLKVIGIAINKSNLEAAGLIMVASLFFIRSIGLIADGMITNADINNLVIAAGIMASNLIRLTQVLNNHRFLVTEIMLKAKE